MKVQTGNDFIGLWGQDGAVIIGPVCKYKVSTEWSVYLYSIDSVLVFVNWIACDLGQLCLELSLKYC